MPVSHREIGGAQPPKASSLAAAAQTPSSPNRGSQEKALAFASAFSVIFALRRVILLRSDIRLTASDIRFASVKANIISLRGSAISLLRQQKYLAAHRAAYH